MEEKEEKKYDFNIILETLINSDKKEFNNIKKYLLSELFCGGEEEEENKESWIINKLIKNFIIKKGKLKLKDHSRKNLINRIKSDLYDNLDYLFVFNKKENYNEFGESIIAKIALNLKSYLIILHSKKTSDNDAEEEHNLFFWTNIFIFINVLDNCRLYTLKIHETILKIFSDHDLVSEIQLFFTLLFILNMLFSFNSTQFTYILNLHYIKNNNKTTRNLK